MNTELYIYSKLQDKYIQVDLYKDETITIESSLQDIRTIDTTNTDYSQNFKVPPTPNNESLFQHWYDSSVLNGFDNRSDIPALLYVDGELFRKGVIRINSVQALRNAPLHYDITFFGKLRTLLDKFLNKKLIEVTALDDITYSRTFADYTAALTGSNSLPIMYPLISPTKLWTYDSGSINNPLDISKPAGAINMDELYPAVSLPTIFSALETQFDIAFTGSFLSEDRFTRAYCLFGGSQALNLSTVAIDLTFPNGSITTPLSTYFQRVTFDKPYLRYTGITSFGPQIRLIARVTADSTTTWEIQPYLNGGKVNTKTGQPINILRSDIGPTGEIFSDVYTPGGSGFEGLWEFELKTSNNLPITVELDLIYSESGITLHTNTISTGALIPTSQLSLTAVAPDILISEFLKGILNMFNLSLYSIREDVFEVEPLEDWYNKGARYNIDPYVKKDFKYVSVPVFDEVTFKYKESKALFNELHRNSKSAGKDYGNLEYANDEYARGTKFNVNVPFENLLFTRVLTDSALRPAAPKVAYLLDSTFKPFRPGVCIMYHSNTRPLSRTIFYKDSTNSGNTNQYNEFGPDLTRGGFSYQDDSYTLNFGLEEDPLNFYPSITGSLFNEYYEFRIDQAFNQSTRILEVEAKLPSELLNKLELNDSLIVEGQAYQINKQSTDLYTGITTFELLTQTYLPPIEPINTCTPLIATVEYVGP
jgi:hypothetical protein